jgi:multimeric flavodoxin WrbA
MKIIAVKGSPRPNGETNKLIGEFLRGAKAAGHETVTYFIQDMNLHGCESCYTCKQEGPGSDCVMKDDLKPYWPKIHETDALVLGAPIYAGNICGPMITYMNRHYCLLDKGWNVRVKPGIQVYGVFAQGRPEKDLYMPQIRWFLKDFENRKMIVKDIMVKAGTTPLPKEDPMLMHAYELGYNLA